MSLEAQAIIDGLHAYQYPSVYPYALRILIASGAIYFFVLLLCISILAIPVFRGVQARRRHLWFWRKQYLPGRTNIPYLVPNGGLAVVIAQLIGCIIFEVYILLSYQALQSPEFARSHYQYFWLTISYAPGYFGFWYSGFSALYICLFSPSRAGSHYPNKQRHMPHPIIMNTVCIGPPIFTALGAIGWGIVSVVTVREKNMAYDAVLAQLADGLDPTSGLERYAVAGNRFIEQFRWASLCWSIAAFIAVVFYCITIVLFLRLLKGTVDVASGKTNLLGQTERNYNVVEEGRKSEVLVSTIALVSAVPSQNSRVAQNLRNGYRLLVLHCCLLTIVLLWYFVVGMFLTVKIELIRDHEGWRSLSIWAVVSSSFLLSAALLLQSWRVLTDRDVTHEGPSPTVSTPKQTKEYNALNVDSSIQFQPAAGGNMERANSTTQMLPNPLSITNKPPHPVIL